jgi:AI-2 transport protein TqsA
LRFYVNNFIMVIWGALVCMRLLARLWKANALDCSTRSLTMPIKIDLSPTLRFLFAGAAIGIILVVMSWGAVVVNSFFLALVIAICFVPLLNWLQRKGLGSGLALIITIVTVIAGVVALVLFLGISLSQLIETLPTYQEDLEARLVGVREGVESVSGVGTSPDWLSAQTLLAFAIDLLTALVNSLYQFGFMLFIAFYMLWEAVGLPTKMRRELPADHPLLQRFNSYSQELRGYVYITAQVGALAGLLDTILLLIVGVDFALLWGVLSAILSFIPSIGFILALIPPVLLGLMQFGWQTALIVLIGYVLINGSVDQIIKPRLYGEGLNLAPLAVFLALFVFGFALGPLGGLLAIPLLLSIRAFILQSSESTRWVANVLKAERTRSKPRSEE